MFNERIKQYRDNTILGIKEEKSSANLLKLRLKALERLGMKQGSALFDELTSEYLDCKARIESWEAARDLCNQHLNE